MSTACWAAACFSLRSPLSAILAASSSDLCYCFALRTIAVALLAPSTRRGVSGVSVLESCQRTTIVPEREACTIRHIYQVHLDNIIIILLFSSFFLLCKLLLARGPPTNSFHSSLALQESDLYALLPFVAPPSTPGIMTDPA